jgi:PPP family 3-phenylpropionic acid transporter
MGVYYPFMSAWYRARGVSGVGIGILSALMPILSVLAPPAIGMVADAFGLRGALLRASVIGGISSLALLTVAAAFCTPEPSFAVLFTCAVVFTFFRNPMLHMADVIALENPGDYGRVRLWGSIGFLACALLAGRYLPLSPAWPLPLVCTLGAFGVLAASFRLPGRAPKASVLVGAELRRLLDNRSFRWFLLTSGLGQAAHAGYDWCISLHLLDLGASGTQVGSAWALATAAEVVLMAFSGRLLAQRTLGFWLCLALAVGSARWLVLSLTHDVFWVLMTQPLHALSFALRWVCSLHAVREISGTGAMGTAQGVFAGVFSLGSAAGMLASGALYDLGLGPLVFAFSTGLGVCAVASCLPLIRQRPRTAPSEAHAA